MEIYIKFLLEKLEISSFNSPPIGRCWYCRQSNAKQICFPTFVIICTLSRTLTMS